MAEMQAGEGLDLEGQKRRALGLGEGAHLCDGELGVLPRLGIERCDGRLPLIGRDFERGDLDLVEAQRIVPDSRVTPASDIGENLLHGVLDGGIVAPGAALRCLDPDQLGFDLRCKLRHHSP